MRFFFICLLFVCCGASYRTPNFVVTAPTDDLAKKVGMQAEGYRESLARDWLGKKLPTWNKPCPIEATLEEKASGSTTFIFDKGEVFGWEMKINGSEERLLDSVLPHEILHTVLASHFRQPLPRWADEGAAISVEHVSERDKYQARLLLCVETNQNIPFTKLLQISEYPSNSTPLYSEGSSLARLLIELGGKREFVSFLDDGLKNDWPTSLRSHYGSDCKTLESDWLSWVMRGSPQIVKALQ